MTALGEAAASYGRRGWAVLPLVARDKVPAIKGGCNMATDDHDTIEEWWADHENTNIGIATGTPSRGLVVIDVDVDPDKGEDGYATLRDWEREHGELPETVTAITGRGGLHLYYYSNEPISNAINAELGIDIRGEGGYVVAPPSVHPNGKEYAWEHDPEEFSVAAADANVYAFIRHVAGEKRRGERFSLPSVIEAGARNDTLFKYASSLQSRGYDDVYIEMSLEKVNEGRCKPPLPKSDVLQIIRSVTERYEKGDTERLRRDADSPPVYRKLDRNGQAKGAILHDKLGQDLIDRHKACYVDGAPAVWNGERYATGWNEVSKKILDLVRDAKVAEQREVLRYVALQAEEVEASDPRLIAFSNGVLDIERGMQPYDDTMVITNIIPHDYDESAYSEVADGFLNRISKGDALVRRNLEEVIGMCLYRANDFGVCPVLIGTGANGKSTFILALRHLLGHKNVSALDINVLGRPFQAARLVGKLANLGDDISNERLNGDVLAIFKKIVTGDWIYTDVKNGDGFEFKPYCTLIFSCNEFPSLGDSSEGMLRRLFPIPFDAHFTRDDADYDPRLWEKLKDEDAMRYLARLGVEGLRRVLEQRGLTPNARSEELVADVKSDNSNIVQWLEDQGLKRSDFVDEVIAERYGDYKNWCEASGMRFFSKSKFTRKINAEFGLKSVSVKRRYADGPRSVRVFRIDETTENADTETE